MLGTAVLFITILLGFLFGYWKVFRTGNHLVLIHFVFYFALPITLFYSCYRSHYVLDSDEIHYNVVYILAIVTIILMTYLLSRKCLHYNRVDSVDEYHSLIAGRGCLFYYPSVFIFI